MPGSRGVACRGGLGCCVGSDSAVDACDVGQGWSAVRGSSSGRRGDYLAVPDRGALAGPAGGVRPVADDLKAACPLLQGWDVGQDPRSTARAGGRQRADRLGSQRGLHDQPCPSARDESASRHRGRGRITRICFSSPLITASGVPAAGCQRRSTSSSTDEACRWSSWSGPTRQRLTRIRRAAGPPARGPPGTGTPAHAPGPAARGQGVLLARQPGTAAFTGHRRGHPATVRSDRPSQAPRLTRRPSAGLQPR